MQVTFSTSAMRLEATPLDIGYASQKVTLTGGDNKAYSLGGQNGKTQLIITTPFIDNAFKEELKSINTILAQENKEELNAAIVVANESHEDPKLDYFDFMIDTDDEFADWYGVTLTGEPCDGELTKALFLITRDGALFYDDIVSDLHEPFDLQTLERKILAAKNCYTGKGCH